MNVYNIPSNYNFIKTLANWLKKHYNNEFSELKIFLPNQRSSRKLRKELLNLQDFNVKSSIKIKSFADLNIEDLYDFLPNKLCAEIIAELSKIKVLNRVDAIFLLCEEVKKNTIFGTQNFTQRYKIAKSLYQLFEDLEENQVDASQIKSIDDSNLAKHHQFTVEFFQSFYIQIKNHLIKNNLMFAGNFHNLLCSKYCEIIETQKISQNIVIAGSTGSILSSKKLIKSIKNYENGCVILYGYQKHLNAEEIHPQYYLNELIKFLDLEKLNVPEIKNLEFINSPEIKKDFCNLIFNDYKNFDNFKKTCEEIGKNNEIAEIVLNLEISCFDNEINEAKSIVNIIKEYNQKDLEIAVICNNQNLSRILKSYLNAYQVNYNDASSQSAIYLDIIGFLLLIFEIKNNEFNSHIFLSFLKHNFFVKLNNEKLIEEFEINILRDDRINLRIEGIEAKIKNSKFADFFNKIIENLPIDNSLNSLIKAFEFFTNQNFNQILSKSIAGKEIFEFFELLKQQNFYFQNIEDLKIIFNEISYFEKSKLDSNVDILSPIEARLLNFDLIIVSSLNENDFPQIDNHGWIGAKIKKDLGVNKTLKKIGQNGFDFCNYLSNKKIILTHSKYRLGQHNVESPFITKLKTLCKILNLNIDKSQFYQRKINENLHFIPQYLAPSFGNPSENYRPKNYYITDISHLISNPYFIYVKKVLKIEELKKIDYEPSYAEFGSFIHKALEDYIKNPTNINFEEIFEKYFLSKQAKLIWYPKFLKIFENFCEDNQEFIDDENILEESIKIDLENIKISGKVDRILIDNEKNIKIIDYKTGQVPTKKDVICGLEPQLTVYALILSETLFKNSKIKELNYWKLTRTDGSKIIKIFNNEDEISEAILATKNGLKIIFDYFSNPQNKFFATKNEEDDYIQNLSRIKEWNQ
jgi:ATP-dependent helicase/nuclease subunit B